jgi:release factor glutamine methyltransferase
VNGTISDPIGLTWGEILCQAARCLTDAGVPEAMRDARRLLTAAQGITIERVSLVMPDRPTEAEIDRFLALVARRRAREPMAHILGKREFFGRTFVVTADVLDPRPETEHLIEAALQEPFSSVLDLGTGSGCIMLTLLADRPMARGVGSDISREALDVARQNCAGMGLQNRCTWLISDWFGAVSGRFDLIVANPPYIGQAEMAGLAAEVRLYEPSVALTPGGDGLDAYRAIAASAGKHLSARGRLIVEIGATQAKEVCALLADGGLRDIRVIADLAGHDRVVTAKPGAFGVA